MNQEFKKEWIEALESNKYEQGDSQLKTSSGKFCCLGVACDLLVKKGVVEEYIHNDTSYYKMPDEVSGDYEVLSKGIAEYLGIERNPDIKVEDEYYGPDYVDIATLNDEGMTFPEIAKLIKEQL